MLTFNSIEKGCFLNFNINSYEETNIHTMPINDSILDKSLAPNEVNGSFLENANNNIINENNEINIMSLPKKTNQVKNSLFTFNRDSSNHIKNDNINKMMQNKKIGFNNPKNIKQKIFRILKDYKSKGRIKKIQQQKYVGKHNKFCEDNIIRKIKGRFLEKCRIYINNEYNKHLLLNENRSKNEILLQRITPKVSRKIKKEDNLKWFKSKLYQVFSEQVSVKCSLYQSDYNKKEIQKLYEEKKADNVIIILNKSVKEMFDAYILKKNIPGLSNLYNDLKELREKMEQNNEENIEKYLNKYKNTALNLERIFIKKSSRNKS